MSSKQDYKMIVENIVNKIISGECEDFCYAHFHSSNMADYTLMSSTIRDLCWVYDISDEIAAEVVQVLTH